MDQFDSVLKLSTTQLLPLDFEKTFESDEFAKELIDLWKERKMEGKVYVVYLYTLPVGFILVQETERDWTIRGTFVAEWTRGKGVGSWLLKKVLDGFEKSGKYCLWVNITEGAESFYLQHGFQLLGRRKDFPDQIIGVYTETLSPQNLLLQMRLKYEDNCVALYNFKGDCYIISRRSSRPVILRDIN